VVASEIMGPLYYVTPDEDLYAALLKFAESGYAQLPVFASSRENEGEAELLGMLDRRAVFEAYASGMHRVRTLQEQGDLVVPQPLPAPLSSCKL
jgi:chloride channel protein, CIC family